MRALVAICLVVVGFIHLLPLTGVLGSEKLATLYGTSFADPNLEILMRHRAVLFGLLGAFLIVAAFRREWQTAAFVAGAVSVLSFLLLARVSGGYNAQLGRVVVVDLIALASLVVGAVARWALSRRF